MQFVCIFVENSCVNRMTIICKCIIINVTKLKEQSIYYYDSLFFGKKSSFKGIFVLMTRKLSYKSI